MIVKYRRDGEFGMIVLLKLWILVFRFRKENFAGMITFL